MKNGSSGETPANVPPAIPLQRFLQPIEVILTTYKTLVFLIAYCIVAGLWIWGPLDYWYEFLTLMVALTALILISRVQQIRFYGLEIVTSQWMEQLQSQLLWRQAFPELYEAQVASYRATAGLQPSASTRLTTNEANKEDSQPVNNLKQGGRRWTTGLPPTPRRRRRPTSSASRAST